MPSFKFKAKNLEGKEINGTREAEDKFALARALRQENYILIDFQEEGKKRKWNIFSFSFDGVPFAEKMIFTHNLAVMVGAGISLTRALGILIEQSKNVKFKKIILKISNDITKGRSLSDSLSDHKKIFSALYVSMVKAGEKSGKLHESLNLLADQMEKEMRIKRKIRGAMVYPLIVLITMVGIAILMLIYVVPSLVSTFGELGIQLPLSTRIIIWLSRSLISSSLLILSVFVVLVISFIYLLRLAAVRKFLDGAWLRLPIISPLIQKINSARTARTLSSLIDSGVEILEAMTITSEVVQNVHYKNVLMESKKDIQKGEAISVSIRKSKGVFPLLFGEMVAVGEETGKLSEMLLQLAVFYEEEVNEATKDMATVIEPVLMVVIGAAVGFFAISMVKPMYSMLDAI
ncbi:type II secretion system F family protein [Patescibacteria group bacterium]|nr:type II secretion system F family protein [Patescibacteria group bacterium]